VDREALNYPVPRPERFSLYMVRLLFSLVIGSQAALVSAQQASLVTYGTGSEVWELFGHNAIWLEDADSGLDHTFSFGYFELDRPGFHRDFARGIMPYYGATSVADREFAWYRQRGRSIRVQRLDLEPDQVHALYRLLEEAIFPIPQYYPYNYYLDNCSTRLRDLLDEVTEGALSRHLKDQPERMNFRDHTRRLTRSGFWLHTGIMTLLGPDIDRSRSAWDEAFLPESLADWLAEIRLDGRALVASDEFMTGDQGDRSPGLARSGWIAYAMLGLLSLLLIVAPSSRGYRWPWFVGVLTVSLAGLIIGAMWLLTGHEFTWRNLMILVLNPLWLVFLIPALATLRPVVWWLLTIALVLGALIMAWPGGPQYRLDQLLWFVPLCVALLMVAARNRGLHSSSDRKGLS
jgi:hypothetical protein